MTDDKRLITHLDDEVNMGNLAEVHQLLEQGADVNGRNALGDTPLMAAAWTGQPEMVRLLYRAGADTAALTRDGKTAKQLAEQLGHQEILSAFAELEASC